MSGLQAVARIGSIQLVLILHLVNQSFISHFAIHILRVDTALLNNPRVKLYRTSVRHYVL